MRTGPLLILLAALTGYGSAERSAAEAAKSATAVSQDVPNAITVTSPDFVEGQTLKLGQVYAGLGCVGSNRSPALSWTPVENAMSYAVSVFDPDASGGGWWHWTLANIPASVTSLAVGAGGRRGVLPTGAIQGQTDFGSPGYGGPCPPVGDAPHRYVFTVYALGIATIPADDATDGAAFQTMVDQHVIAKGTITARYGR